MEQHETILTWLNDALAMEESSENMLSSHAQDFNEYPEIQQQLQEHIEQTQEHARKIRERIEQLGGEVSGVKSMLGAFSGTLQGVGTGLAVDEPIKNLLADYTAEHFEIASYTSLIAGAEAAGDPDTAALCQEILAEEQTAAQMIEAKIPELTSTFIRQTPRLEEEADEEVDLEEAD
jgi:ferritin-like metal-binding protein YciE